MIYQRPLPDDPLDQGDVIDECPVLSLATFLPDNPDALEMHYAFHRVIVLTQTCDLANMKTTAITVAIASSADDLVARQILKASDVRGQIRAGRVYGWYFLPRNDDLNLPEMIVDFRQLHTLRRDVLTALCKKGRRRGRVQPLYREHLAKHFADTFSRIGLPVPYETM